MPAAAHHADPLLKKNAELTARLKVSEHSIDQLREQLADLATLQGAYKQLQSEHSRTIERKVLLEEEVRFLKAQLYGRSSEKSSTAVSPDQRMLFNEAEVLVAIAAADEAHANRTTPIEAHERKHSGGRKAIPEHFPRQVIVHDVPDEERYCGEGHERQERRRIGEEISEQYHFEPPKLWVEQHVRIKRACQQCHEGVKVAPVPPMLLPKSMAGASILAQVVTGKFVDGLPLYRQSRQFERLGLSLGTGTLAQWVNTIGGEKVVPLINLLHEEQLRESLILCDESTLQVLKSDKSPTSDHYMVVRAAGPPGRRIILFNYIPSRTLAAMKELFIGPDGPYQGRLLTDGLEIYDLLSEQMNLLHFTCNAHCRRYYTDAMKVSELPSGRSLARVAVEDYYAKLYAVERRIKALREERERAGGELSLQEVLSIRQQHSAPLMKAFKNWVDDLLPGIPPQSALGKALSYTINRFEKLSRFVDYPDVAMDTNYVEQQIRPFAVARKAFLFADTQAGARASANLYSLVSSAKANGVEPYAYLRYVFEQLPRATTVEQFEALLPWNVKAVLKERQRKASEL